MMTFSMFSNTWNSGAMSQQHPECHVTVQMTVATHLPRRWGPPSFPSAFSWLAKATPWPSSNKGTPWIILGAPLQLFKLISDLWCLCAHVCHGMCGKVRGHLCGFGSLSTFTWLNRSSSGYLACIASAFLSWAFLLLRCSKDVTVTYLRGLKMARKVGIIESRCIENQIISEPANLAWKFFRYFHKNNYLIQHCVFIFSGCSRLIKTIFN